MVIKSLTTWRKSKYANFKMQKTKLYRQHNQIFKKHSKRLKYNKRLKQLLSSEWLRFLFFSSFLFLFFPSCFARNVNYFED